jgi:hypothetical protein
MRMARWGLALLLVSPVGAAVAQPQQDQTPPPAQQQEQDPVAAAARHARDQKKDQTKAAKVYDNDSLPNVPGAINVVGQAPSASDASANPPPADQAAAAASGQANNAAPGAAAKPADAAAVSSELESAKAKLLSLQKDLDILQRKYALDEQMFLVNPNKDSDREGAAALRNQQSQMAVKQQEVADAQKRVDELQAKLGPGAAK